MRSCSVGPRRLRPGPVNSLTQSRWFLLQGSCSGTQGLCLDVRARVLRAVGKEYMLGLLTSFFCKIPFGPGWRSVTRPRATARGPRAFVRPALALALGAQLVSCGRSNHETSEGFPRAETLYVGGRQWGEPSSFNPLSGSPDWPAKEWHTLLYESLFYFNSREGKLSPLLGQSYKVTDDTVEVTLDPAARWNDGKPLTAWDVKYTYDLGQKYRGPAGLSPLAIHHRGAGPRRAGATEPGTVNASTGGAPRKVVFVLDKSRKNPLVVLDALQEIRIVPRHVIEPVLASVNGDFERVQQARGSTKIRWARARTASSPTAAKRSSAVRDDGYWGNAVLHGGKLPAPEVRRSPHLQEQRPLQRRAAAGAARRLVRASCRASGSSSEGGAELVRQGAVLRARVDARCSSSTSRTSRSTTCACAARWHSPSTTATSASSPSPVIAIRCKPGSSCRSGSRPSTSPRKTRRSTAPRLRPGEGQGRRSKKPATRRVRARRRARRNPRRAAATRFRPCTSSRPRAGATGSRSCASR